MKHRRNDIILILVFLIISAAAWIFFSAPGQAGGWAVVSVDGQEIGRYPLDADLEMTFGDAEYNTVVIRDGAVAVSEANCGDHTCMRRGEIDRSGETIICLPHRLIIEIVGGDNTGPDAIAG